MPDSPRLADLLAAVETLGANHDWPDADRRAYRLTLRERLGAPVPIREAALNVPDTASPLEALHDSLQSLRDIASCDPLLELELSAVLSELNALRGHP
jgi:hypothetical protein